MFGLLTNVCMRESAELILRNMELRGQVWDPEPLPERLAHVITRDGEAIRILVLPDAGDDLQPFPGPDAYAEAVRRYNAWKEIQNLCLRAESGHESYIDVVQNIIAILKGEPHG